MEDQAEILELSTKLSINESSQRSASNDRPVRFEKDTEKRNESDHHESHHSKTEKPGRLESSKSLVTHLPVKLDCSWNDGYHHLYERTPSLRGDGYGGGGTSFLQHGRRSMSNSGTYNVQSHNYELDESEVWRAYVAAVQFQNRGQWWTTAKTRSLRRWILTFIVGVLQGFIAATCNFCSKYLSTWKFHYIHSVLNPIDLIVSSEYDNAINQETEIEISESSNVRAVLKAFVMFISIQGVYTAIAAFFVWWEPLAGGSGIPEIKAFLNGVNIPRILRFQTLITRVLGIIFSVAAGLPLGMEGPMVHSGAVVAAGISQGQLPTCVGNAAGLSMVDDITSFAKFSDFRNDREKRDFVACGTAAGVCSAFNSPVGGVLFAFEEASSYFSTKLTWRAFFCAMSTLATLFWIRNVGSLWGQADIEKLFSLGEFKSLSGVDSNFSIWELTLFVIVGCLGGLIGAVFNASTVSIARWRGERINNSRIKRFLEALAISLLVSIVSFVMPLLWSRCTPIPTDTEGWTNQEKKLLNYLVPFLCKRGEEYNEVASLMFTPADVSIKQLFHFREDGAADTSTFSSGALFIFFFPYITLAALTYGSAVPAGLFVPSLLSGAAFGRLVGHLLHKLDHTNGTFADSGTYALIGSAAVLGGMARMTISFTVIILEATGDMQYVLPLMLTLMAARFTGNVFNDGIYDINIKLKNIPFLEPDVPSIAERNEIVAGQVMSTEVKCLRQVERAGVVFDLLRSCGHGNFPIIDTGAGGTLCGTVSRYMLCTLLQRRAFGAPDVIEKFEGLQQNLGPRRLTPLVQWDTIERAYPKYPTISDIRMTDIDRDNWVDLRPYANTAPYTINETASIQRTYRLFRTMGLRFLCVVNHNNQVVGIITRKDLMPEALRDSLLRGRNVHASKARLGRFT